MACFGSVYYGAFVFTLFLENRLVQLADGHGSIGGAVLLGICYLPQGRRDGGRFIGCGMAGAEWNNGFSFCDIRSQLLLFKEAAIPLCVGSGLRLGSVRMGA